jgi:integrase
LKFLDLFCTLFGMSRTKRKRIKRRGKDRFEPRKTFVNGQLYWQVDYPEKLEGQEKIVWKRKTVRDHETAKTHADEARIKAKNYERSDFAIPGHVLADTKRAVELLEPLGATILEAAKFYAEHLNRVRTSKPVATAVEELQIAKTRDNLRTRYLNDLKVRLNRFSQSFGERPIATISAGEINAWLRALAVNPFTRNTFRLRISTLFSYAIERGWCRANPVKEVKKLKASAGIGILTPEQFAKVLEAASEATLPYWLLGGFAGLRRAEIERLEWKDILFDLVKYRAFTQAISTSDKEAIAKAEKEWRPSTLVEVPALKAKTASRRFVQIQDNLAAWIEPYIGRTGNVCPRNLRKLLEADRKAAGLKSWPSNALRHGFASYHLAHFNDAAKLALELGHTDQELIFRNYRELVRPSEAEKYWNIRPATQTNLVAISA